MKDFSAFFLKRPILAGVLSILIFVAGLIAIPLLPVAEYPDVVPPSVQVRAMYPGAGPEVIAEMVATGRQALRHAPLMLTLYAVLIGATALMFQKGAGRLHPDSG